MSKTDSTRPIAVQVADPRTRFVQRDSGATEEPLVRGYGSKHGRTKTMRKQSHTAQRARDRSFCHQARTALEQVIDTIEILPIRADFRSMGNRAMS